MFFVRPGADKVRQWVQQQVTSHRDRCPIVDKKKKKDEEKTKKLLLQQKVPVMTLTFLVPLAPLGNRVKQVSKNIKFCTSQVTRAFYFCAFICNQSLSKYVFYYYFYNEKIDFLFVCCPLAASRYLVQPNNCSNVRSRLL